MSLNYKFADLIWQYALGSTNERLLGKEHVIARWPVRSSVVVEQPHGGVAVSAVRGRS